MYKCDECGKLYKSTHTCQKVIRRMKAKGLINVKGMYGWKTIKKPKWMKTEKTYKYLTPKEMKKLNC